MEAVTIKSVNHHSYPGVDIQRYLK